MPDALPRLLNINDDEATRYVLSKHLRSAGFTVLEATTGRQGLQLARAEKPDLVVLDVRLPDLGGVQVLRQLRADPATSSIAVLLVSASLVKSENRVEGLEEGADGYLAQPVSPPELIATVRSLLRMREAESAAQALSAQWQATFDAISDAVCLVDSRGRILRCNEAFERLVGGGSRDVLGVALEERLQRLAPPTAELSVALQPPFPSTVLELKLGSRWYRLSSGPVVPAHGQMTGAVCVLADISGRRLLEQELRQRAEALSAADKRKDEFLAMLAHELRNPLAAISAGLQLLDRVGSREERVIKVRQLVSRQTRHLARLVDDLLDVSRITRGKIELRKELLDLGTALKKSVESAKSAVDERGHQMELVMPEEPIWVHADPARLDQVLTNLLDNAAKYTKDGGKITVWLCRQGDEAVVRVRDNGIGIRPELLDRIFELFAQVDEPLDRGRGGLGIGLTLVRRLIQMHDGGISAHSDGLGKGTEFVVWLPSPKSPQLPAAAPRPAPRTAARSGCRVLLVEDNADAREALRDLLQDCGYQVEVAADGLEGLERATRAPPDVALVDIGLPGMDGYQVARNLRTTPEGKGLFLVALTGYGGGEQKRLALDAGFDLHLVKPVDPDELMAVLEQPKVIRGMQPPEDRERPLA